MFLGALDNPPEQKENEAPHRVFNIGNSRSENLMDFIKIIEKELGKSGEIEFLPMQPGDIAETYADTVDTTEVTGF